MTMKTRTNLVLVAGLSLGILLCASLCFGQETALERAARVYGNSSRLSPNTRLQLYSHDPNICHCNDCVSARLAAGIEYQGFTPIQRPRRLTTPPSLRTRRLPPPPVYTPPKPRGYGGFYIYCRSTNSVITRDQCPDK